MTLPSADFLDLQSALAGEYSLQRELGRGGMGIVYLARDVQLDRDVAIKVLPPDLAMGATARERFLREARMAAGLSHPNIVPIHRVGEAGGYSFFVMSFVDGETLGERLRAKGPLAPADATRVIREVAWALAYAHGRGIIHRDVKPDNIMLEARGGRAIVTDFGIAHAADAEQGGDGKVTGTAHFMSPEQAADLPLDGRSDIYSLGVVGFLSVSGRLPFDAPNLHAVLLQQATEDPPAVSSVAPGLPTALANAIDRCIARDPVRRFADGEALADALAPLPEARPVLPPTLRAWLAKRNPLLLPYIGWSGLMSVLTTGNLYALAIGQRPGARWDILLLVGAVVAPLVPIVGFHLNQARRQFLAGHTLADLRSALEIERRERHETEASVSDAVTPMSHRLLRVATAVSASSLLGVFVAASTNMLWESGLGPYGFLVFVIPFFSTLGFGALSNALDVQFVPNWLKELWHNGIRGKLWKSRVGEWIAKKLGAPERSRLAGANAFRATEVALGVAASELYKALPKVHREQLAELPDIVSNFEARAAEARAELDIVAAMAPSGTADAAVLEARKKAAAGRLSESVAALEGIRLDLLRLHAGAADLAPLTTLIDASRRIGEDIHRLADAQREVNEAMGLRPPAGERLTPA